MRQMNVVGKPDEGEPPVRFEVAGAGDGSLDTAPALDPTFAWWDARKSDFPQQRNGEGAVVVLRKAEFSLTPA